MKSNDLFKVAYIIALNKINLTDPLIYDGKKRFFIHLACMFAKKPIIEFLALNGCKLDCLDQDSCKPLEAAMLINNVTIFTFLIT